MKSIRPVLVIITSRILGTLSDPPSLYISRGENVLEALRRSSPSIRDYEIEVALHDYNLEGLSHVRRLDNVTAEKPTLLMKLVSPIMAIGPATTYSFKSVKFPSNAENEPTSIASDIMLLVNDPDKMRGLTALSVNKKVGTVHGITRGIGAKVRSLDNYEWNENDQTLHDVGTKRIFDGLRITGVKSTGRRRDFSCGVDSDHGRHREHTGHDRRHDRHLQTDLFSSDALRKDEAEQMQQVDEGSIFQVNVVIDIDAEFIQNQGGPEEAIEYVNFLVSSANVMFENEVGVHLNIVQIQEVSYFSAASDLREALNIMRDRYDGNFPKGITLRHALLGRFLGGGIAFINAVCDDGYGVGLSSGLAGRIGSLDEDAVYDLVIMAHEIGHSLGSDHTFEKEAFNPVVDSCNLDRCSKDLPLPSAATIMSYCDLCEGGLSNIALSFGGVWTGKHPRSDVGNWKESPEVSDSQVSNSPERVTHQIWKTLSSKGTCVLSTSTPTSPPSTAKPTNTPVTSLPTTNPITSSPTIRPTTASPTVTPTVNHGPFVLGPQTRCTDDCYLSPGVMFDVGLESNAKDILIESVWFEFIKAIDTNVTVDLYRTYVGTYENKVKFDVQWTQLATVNISVDASIGSDTGLVSTKEIKLDPPVALAASDTFGFYLAASRSILRVGTGSSTNADVNGVFIGPGSSVVGGVFGVGVEGYLLNIKINYSFPPLTVSSTTRPTRGPTPPPSVRTKTNKPSGSALISSPTVSNIARPTNKPTTAVKSITSPEQSYWISPVTFCQSNCLASSGFMFNIELTPESKNILITSVSFEHLKGTGNNVVEVFSTVSGSLVGKEQLGDQWIKVATVNLPNTPSQTTAVIDPPVALSPGNTRGFYLVTVEGILLVGFGSSFKLDPNGASIEDGTVVFRRFGDSYAGYQLNAHVSYVVAS